jgi:acyl carrier protein
MATEPTSIESFLEKLEPQFDDLPAQPLTSDTLFRTLPGWTSLQSLVVIISFDEEYGVTVSAEELQRAQTLGDLYRLVKEKQGL